jgi:arsenite methyltransferase
VAGEIDLSDPQVVDVYDDLPLWSAMAGQLLLALPTARPETSRSGRRLRHRFPGARAGPATRTGSKRHWNRSLGRGDRSGSSQGKIWGVNNVMFIDGDATAMPFPDSSFDLIVSNLGLNNFADPDWLQLTVPMAYVEGWAL